MHSKLKMVPTQQRSDLDLSYRGVIIEASGPTGASGSAEEKIFFSLSFCLPACRRAAHEIA